MGFTFGGTLFSDSQSFEFPDDKSGTVALKQDINGGAKVYRALLSQSGTDAPVATVLENTIGTITYDYDSAGSYGLNSSALFTSGKTFVMGGGSSNNASTYVYLGEINSTSRIGIRARDLEGTFSDDIMANTPIEILVYS